MCLILFAWQQHPDYPLIVAANRDEFHQRPTAAAQFWPDAPELCAGRDLHSGGTWLGVTRTGRFAAVTNYREAPKRGQFDTSRGALVTDFLRSSVSVPAQLQHCQQTAARYDGYNLLLAANGELAYVSNRGGAARLLDAGVYGLSNHLLDTAWYKVQAGKQVMQHALSLTGEALVAALFAGLADETRPPDELLPNTGVDFDWERLLSARFIVDENYGTRSATVVLWRRDGTAELIERQFSPSGELLGEQRFLAD